MELLQKQSLPKTKKKKLTIEGPDEVNLSSGGSLLAAIESSFTAKFNAVEVDGTFDYEDVGSTSDGDDLIKIIFTPDSNEYDVADKTVTLKAGPIGEAGGTVIGPSTETPTV